MKKYQDMILGLAMVLAFYTCAFIQSNSVKVECKQIHAQMEEHGAQAYSDVFKGQQLKDIERACK